MSAYRQAFPRDQGPVPSFFERRAHMLKLCAAAFIGASTTVTFNATCVPHPLPVDVCQDRAELLDNVSDNEIECDAGQSAESVAGSNVVICRCPKVEVRP